jgi:uncharacterized coiled-coil DUF342 family protein
MIDPEEEEEDLMDPKDELKKKIVALANIMREWNEKTKEARESVRKQLRDILDLGLNQRKMEKTELRDLINEIFEYHGIHQSWLRKLLPEVLKDTSKTRLSYLQKQKIEEERQRLLRLQQSSDPQQQEFEAETEYESLPDGHAIVSSRYQSQDSKNLPSSLESTQEYVTKYEAETKKPTDPRTSLPSEETGKTIQNQLNEANKRLEDLKVKVQLLSEEFVAKTPFYIFDEDVVLAIRIDPIKKVILEFWIENATSI